LTEQIIAFQVKRMVLEGSFFKRGRRRKHVYM